MSLSLSHTPSMLRPVRRWLPWVLLALVAAGAGGGAAKANAAEISASTDTTTRIMLRKEAMLATGADAANGPSTILLRDIAELSGPAAETLGATVIADRASLSVQPSTGLTTISMSMVRSALEAANVHWGKVAVSGSSCVLRVAPSAPARTKPSNEPTRKVVNPPQPVDVSAPPTIRSLIALRLCELFGANADSIRLGFDPVLAAYLDTPVGESRVDVQTGSSNGAARVTVNVAMYEAERVLSERSLMVEVLLARTVTTASAAVPRGQAFARDSLVESTQWLPPSAKLSATIDELVGGMAAKRIAAGQVIGQDDVETPIVCKRGDVVWVHALAGSVTVKAKCRAMGQARDGEMVQLKLEGSGQLFTARMSGRGRAVAVVGASTSQTPGEPAAVESLTGSTPETIVVQDPPKPRKPARSALAKPPLLQRR